MPVSTVSIPVGQWLVSAEGTRWWFDSGSLALDFATTGSIGGTGIAARADRLHTPDDLSAWLRERFPVAIGVARTRDLFDAISLRDAVGRMAIRASTGEAPSTADIDVVNLYAATPDVPPSIAGGSRQVGRSVHTVPQALSTVARDAVDLFDPANAGRIRQCSGDGLRHGLPRHVARGHASVVLDAALRQPREGACASRAQTPDGGRRRRLSRRDPQATRAADSLRLRPHPADLDTDASDPHRRRGVEPARRVHRGGIDPRRDR